MTYTPIQNNVPRFIVIDIRVYSNSIHTFGASFIRWRDVLHKISSYSTPFPTPKFRCPHSTIQSIRIQFEISISFANENTKYFGTVVYRELILVSRRQSVDVSRDNARQVESVQSRRGDAAGTARRRTQDCRGEVY